MLWLGIRTMCFYLKVGIFQIISTWKCKVNVNYGQLWSLGLILTDQRNWIESPGINSHIYGRLMFEEGAKTTQWGEARLFNK